MQQAGSAGLARRYRSQPRQPLNAIPLPPEPARRRALTPRDSTSDSLSWTLREEFRIEGGTASGTLDDPSFELLAALCFARVEIDAANNFCCGAP